MQTSVVPIVNSMTYIVVTLLASEAVRSPSGGSLYFTFLGKVLQMEFTDSIPQAGPTLSACGMLPARIIHAPLAWETPSQLNLVKIFNRSRGRIQS